MNKRQREKYLNVPFGWVVCQHQTDVTVRDGESENWCKAIRDWCVLTWCSDCKNFKPKKKSK